MRLHNFKLIAYSIFAYLFSVAAVSAMELSDELMSDVELAHVPCLSELGAGEAVLAAQDRTVHDYSHVKINYLLCRKPDQSAWWGRQNCHAVNVVGTGVLSHWSCESRIKACEGTLVRANTICRCSGNTEGTSTSWGPEGKYCGRGTCYDSGKDKVLSYSCTFQYRDSCRTVN